MVEYKCMQDNREAGDRSSFLAGLLKKYADTKRIEEETGKSVRRVLREVDR